MHPIGQFVDLEGEPHFRIAAYHRMAPFLMSVPSDTDLWMFVASEGGLTAGRVDADGSLFPYVTVDRLHHAHHHTGPVTVIHLEGENGEPHRWEPFTQSSADDPLVERFLYKSTTGNQVVFEENHHGLGLSFRYRWAASDEFGWVRSSTLENRGEARAQIRIMDGLRNLLPWGAPLPLYQQTSNLVDAYKKSEVDDETGLGIFSLTSLITDRAEALEALRANTVWCCGLDNPRVHLSAAALSVFRLGKVVAGESVLNGARGNYLVTSTMDLGPGERSRWHIVGDTCRDHLQIAALRATLRDPKSAPEHVEASLRAANENLRRNVASADGLQMSGRPESSSHHFANVLFNNMRGGVFAHNHDIPVDDLADFLQVRNAGVANRHAALLAGLSGIQTVDEVLEIARDTGDADFERLCHEYLPLHFSRRHGDPSRPWNRFVIRARNETGERALGYEGNWRDIFQNWEALAASFPRFLPSMVVKFVNASTVDGFNPYRVTRDGVEWETPSPDDPWSNIGYWGDHQIIYLLKLLEALDRYDPSTIGSLLGREIFSYVDVPYRIKPYGDLVADPRSTIVFDCARATLIDESTREQGTDGKLLNGEDGSSYHANLLEKLLVPILSKLSNLVPDAGIWMNTQRPEWNDANNALGGGGVSVVTLCYLRRYLAFLSERLEPFAGEELPVSVEIVEWFDRIADALAAEESILLTARIDGRDRKRMMDALGSAFSDYRASVYSEGFTGKADVAVERVIEFFRVALCFIEWGLAASRRSDGLFHTYNQLEFSADGQSVELLRLPEMLEGQVAALSSGFLDPQKSLDLLERLFKSDLYHAGHRTFMLYPERDLPGFLQKNTVPGAKVEAIGLLAALVAAGDRSLIARDSDGVYRFNADLRSIDDLQEVLEGVAEQDEWRAAVDLDRAAVLDLFDDVFDHKAYTGRSGVIFGYEGLGCIYWHMVAKLLLATQGCFTRADRDGQPEAVTRALAEMYYRIRSGIGYEKTVAEYGAFPTDPYSHTPAEGGARQPGMTGQVKEEILTRMGEFGVQVENGTVRFTPRLLQADEILGQPGEFHYFDVEGQARALDLPANSLAFTLCQVPVIYEASKDDAWIEVTFLDGKSSRLSGDSLDAQTSADLFSRAGQLDRIRVGVPNLGSAGHWTRTSLRAG